MIKRFRLKELFAAKQIIYVCPQNCLYCLHLHFSSYNFNSYVQYIILLFFCKIWVNLLHNQQKKCSKAGIDISKLRAMFSILILFFSFSLFEIEITCLFIRHIFQFLGCKKFQANREYDSFEIFCPV